MSILDPHKFAFGDLSDVNVNASFCATNGTICSRTATALEHPISLPQSVQHTIDRPIDRSMELSGGLINKCESQEKYQSDDQ